ncbi:unnamed protein product [Polarella glacialis]|uniref:Uncharacterized protein n=1 Tax=Polarella glacialis TaxID=89957 RepID=A0A813LEJ7_POLGL|nr:unnamed protein product [Polarella glacialis]CAE8735531.1 unnamed protein product [Polarella glacialis]
MLAPTRVHGSRVPASTRAELRAIMRLLPLLRAYEMLQIEGGVVDVVHQARAVAAVDHPVVVGAICPPDQGLLIRAGIHRDVEHVFALAPFALVVADALRRIGRARKLSGTPGLVVVAAVFERPVLKNRLFCSSFWIFGTMTKCRGGRPRPWHGGSGSTKRAPRRPRNRPAPRSTRRRRRRPQGAVPRRGPPTFASAWWL